MSRIAFAALNDEPGHMHCSLALARRLRSAGHDVSFTGLSDDADDVRKQGFEYVSLADDVHRKWAQRESKQKTAKWLAADSNGPLRAALGLAEKTAFLFKEYKRQQALVRFFIEQAPSFRAFGWDLVINDADSPLGALIAHRAGLNCILLSTMLPDTDRLTPPPRSPVFNDGTIESMLRLSYEWRLQGMRTALREAKPTELAFSLLDKYHGLAPDQLLNAFAVGSLRKLDTRGARPQPMLLRLPTLIACPRAFDFDHPQRPHEFYIEPLVDLERTEPPFDWTTIANGRPIVYASMGTQSWRMRQPLRFFRAVVAAFRDWPEIQVILNVGRFFDPSALGEVPANVVVVVQAPQIAILRRAALMITHGGLNSIKECIALTVPMVVFPIDQDQPGNAARVVHHGLGLSGDYMHADADSIRAMCREVITNPVFSLCIRRMATSFAEAEQASGSIAIVEEVLRRRNPPPFHSSRML